MTQGLPTVQVKLVKVAPDPNAIVCEEAEPMVPPPWTESYLILRVADLTEKLLRCNDTADWVRDWAARALQEQPDAIVHGPAAALPPSP